MSYKFDIAQTVNQVTVSQTTSPISVTMADGAQFAITTTKNNFTVTNHLNTVTLYSNGIELRIDDFNNYFRGDWVNGGVYQRGDLVDYAHSLYVTYIATLTTYTSVIAPPIDTTHWRRVVWHEAPFDHVTVTNTTHLIGEVIMETPMSNFTVTNTATVGNLIVGDVSGTGYQMAIKGKVYIGGATTFNDSITVASTATLNGNVVIGNAATINGGITVASTAIFNGAATFNNTSTFVGNVNMVQADLSVKSIKINDLQYPTSRGRYGQVLSTNGDTYANWVNLGDLVYWSTNSDLYTNGFNILSGTTSVNPQLTIGSGTTANLKSNIRFAAGGDTISINATNIEIVGNLYGANHGPLKFGSIEFTDNTVQTTAANIATTTKPGTVYSDNSAASGINLNPANGQLFMRWATMAPVSGGDYRAVGGISIGNGLTRVNTTSPQVDVIAASKSAFGGVRIGNGIDVTNGLISLNDAYITNLNTSTSTPATTTRLGSVIIGAGIDVTTNGTISVNASYMNTATTSTIGGVRIGSGIAITTTGTISVSAATGSSVGGVRIGSGINVTSTGTISVSTATTSTLGIVKIGSGINVTSDGTISMNPSYMNTATTSTIGGVVIGTNINVTTTGTISISTATTSTVGVVRIGSGIAVTTTGTISVSTATTSTTGLVRIGSGIAITNTGTISVPIASTSTYGLVKLSSTGTITFDWPVSLTRDLHTDNYSILGRLGSINLDDDTHFSRQQAGGGGTSYQHVLKQNVTFNYSNTKLESEHLINGFGSDGLPLSYKNGLYIDKFNGPVLSRTLATSNDLYGTTVYSNTQTLARIAVGEYAIQRTDLNQWLDDQTQTIIETFPDYTKFGVPNDNAIKIRRVGYDEIKLDSTGISFTTTNTVSIIANNAVSIQGNESISLGSTNVAITATVVAITATILTLSADSIEFKSTITNVSSDILTVGSDQYHSQLNVEKIYNYAGTYAPEFPAGVQFGDSTVQTTAWQPNNLLQKTLDFRTIQELIAYLNTLPPAP